MKGVHKFTAEEILDAGNIILEKVEAPSRVRVTVDDDGLDEPAASMRDDLNELVGHSFGKAPRSLGIRLPAKLTDRVAERNPH